LEENKSTNSANQPFIERIQEGHEIGIFCDLEKHIMFQIMMYCWIN